MAKVVLGVGTSHSPLLVLGGAQWEFRSQDDRRNASLNLLDGRRLSYDQLVAERGEPFAARSDPAGFPALARRAEAALDRLVLALRQARPDVVLVVGDDQGELFGPDNQPALSVFHGPEMVMRPFDHLDAMPPWADRSFWAGYRMDMPHAHPVASGLALDLIHGLIRQGVDVAASSGVSDASRRGFGHAFGFVLQRLMRDLEVPMLPVLLNTYFPPNVPTAARCHEIGGRIHAALAASPHPARVAVVASGGLSHFLCEEAFDRALLQAFAAHDLHALRQVPQEAMTSGTSEVRNWIMVSGIATHLQVDFAEYVPVYRTPAGTGIGLAFMTWS